MNGSASKCKSVARACPTQSHFAGADGTAKVCADWASVSGVSPVSPYLELIVDYRNGDWKRQGGH